MADPSLFVFITDPVTGKIKRVAIPTDFQVGLLGTPSELQLFGRLSLAAASYQTSKFTTTVTLKNEDTIANITTTTAPDSGRVTVKLPESPRNGQLHFIKDATGTGATILLDVTPPTGVLIDGAATQTISSAYGILCVYWYAGSWRVFINNSLASALSYDSTGAGTLSFIHSGATVRAYDNYHRIHNLEGRIYTTNNTPSTVVSFISGVNGRSYGVDAYLMCQHTSTIECARWKLSGHYRHTNGTMVLIASDLAISSSNVISLSGTLTSSAGNIIVNGTGTSTGSFHWGCELRVQELGV